MTRIVRLWTLPDVMLIVPGQSGVVYTNQVMGYACVHPEIEGFLVPFVPDYPIDERGRPAVDTLAERLRAVLENAMWMTASQADQVDSILEDFAESRGTVVDRTRLKDSGEAWVHVNVAPGEFSRMVSWEPCKGILTWNNSD